MAPPEAVAAGAVDVAVVADAVDVAVDEEITHLAETMANLLQLTTRLLSWLPLSMHPLKPQFTPPMLPNTPVRLVPVDVDVVVDVVVAVVAVDVVVAVVALEETTTTTHKPPLKREPPLLNEHKCKTNHLRRDKQTLHTLDNSVKDDGLHSDILPKR